MGWNPRHPVVLDPQFLPKECQLALQMLDLGPEPASTASVVRGGGEEGGEGVVAQGQDVDDGGPNTTVPAAR